MSSSPRSDSEPDQHADGRGQGRLALHDVSPAPVSPSLQDLEVDPARRVRVLPDVPKIDREFDYLIPEAWFADGRADRLTIGSMVRIPLAGRRVAGWVTGVGGRAESAHRLSELSKLSGIGPSETMLELCDWAAWRWAGSRVAFLRAASPGRMVAAAPLRRPVRPVPAGPRDQFDEAFTHGVATVRVAPDDDGLGVALAACRLGDALIIAADASRARHLAVALRRAGVDVALAPDDWARAAGGATVVGSRSAAWMPMPELAAVVVIDEHDERLKEEQSPTWHARDVARERARRRGVPLVMTSAAPSLEALRLGPLLRRDRSAERGDWPMVEVIDRRDENPMKAGLFAEGLRSRVDGDRRVVFVLNRTGRARLLACSGCGELVRSDDASQLMMLIGDELVSPDGNERRPVVCAGCGSTSLKLLRIGVDRAKEELEAFLGEPVDEVTAATEERPTRRVAIGTEAVLHRVDQADVVVFLDIDQELLAVRQRTSEQAMALVTQAARLVGGRDRRGSVEPGRIVFQTRQPDHEVLRAATLGDPSLVAVAERDRRQAMHLPPYGAQVAVSGAGAEAFLAAFGQPDGVQIRGPVDGLWLLRAAEREPILDGLAATSRPSARLRIDVDPLRV
jgi:primosomal protein N' (replication factor Y)